MRFFIASLLVVAAASAGRRRHPLTPSVPRRLAEHAEGARSFVRGAPNSLADPRIEEAVASHFALAGLTLAARAGMPTADANTNALLFLSDDDCWDAVLSAFQDHCLDVSSVPGKEGRGRGRVHHSDTPPRHRVSL